MKILVTGATGYLGASAAAALRAAGYDVAGLARSDQAEGQLRRAGLGVVRGDFSAPETLGPLVGPFDGVVNTASTADVPGAGNGFDRDRDAVTAMLNALDGSGKLVVFTSGSAVFGVFGGGGARSESFEEDVVLPLPAEQVAPPSLSVNPLVVAGLAAAMQGRIDTEKAVLGAKGIRGVVIRPGLVYGEGGSFDIPGLIAAARSLGAAPHVGAGETAHSYLHISDLGELYRRIVERAPQAAIIHGAAGDVTMRDLAKAVSQLIGAGKVTKSVTFDEMLAAAGRPGVSLSLHKVMRAEKTRQLLGWAPTRTDILEDVAAGSYAR